MHVSVYVSKSMCLFNPDKTPRDKRPLRQKATGQKATERNVSIELMEACVSHVPFVAELISSFVTFNNLHIRVGLLFKYWWLFTVAKQV